MGIALPQLAPASEDRVSGAQVIDGSLKFDSDNTQHLTRTPGVGNRRTWTYSCWFKRSLKSHGGIFASGVNLYNGGAGGAHSTAFFESSGTIQVYEYSGGYGYNYRTAQVFRDQGAWYHLVISLDTTIASPASDRVKIYVNGDILTDFSSSDAPDENFEGEINNNVVHYITDPEEKYDGQMSQSTFIDGLALGPGYFGYTDPLTNTWRPKKFKAEGTTVNDGTRWRNYLTASNGSFHADPYGATAAFNGTVGSGSGGYCQAANGSANPNNIIFDVSAIGGIPFKNNVEVWLINNANTVSVNGGPAQSLAGTTFVTVARGPGVLNTIKFERPSTSGASLGTIRVDGVNLRDDLTQNIAFGTNGFYLPFDGSAPIGEDQSGKGNNWTPDNFGGSNSLDKATGAKPILNTVSGGNVARPGVFGSEAGAFYATTSASNSGGKYYFSHDASAQPTFSFIRGATYTFDYSASSSHPLRFATAADAAGSTEYTDGTSISGNVIKFTVPHNAPNTLYYYCNVHNGMGNSISVTTDETKADPYAWKNVLALPLVGSANDVSNQINSGSTTKVITANGTVANYAFSNLYGGSYYFDGSNDYISVADSTDYDFGTADFTIEVWFYTTSIGGDQYIMNYSCAAAGDGHNGINIYNSNWRIGGFSNYLIQGNVGLVANKWTHVAMSRESGTLRVFIDGSKIGETSANVSFDSTSVITFGSNVGGALNFGPGYMQDARIYKGVAKYTSNFVPASTNPDILPDTPSGVSGSSKLAKIPDSITEGAVAFDGTGDYLSTASSSSDFTFGTGDFTVEMFLYNRETGGKGFIQLSDTAGGLKNTSSGVVTIHKDSGANGVFRAYAKNASTGFSTPVPWNTWCHVALTRESGTIKLYVNGKQDATTVSSDTTNYATTYVSIGGYYDTNYLSNCSISNVRINKGTAVYTSDFTPPSAPLTNVTNTKLLCCQSNTSAIAAAVIPTGIITANGNAVASTFSPFNTDINTVRGQETGYCTLNPLTVNTGTFSKGNLRYIGPGSWKTAGSTMSVSTGKWYYEVTLSASPDGQGSSADYHCFGFGTKSAFGSTTGPSSQTEVLQMAGTGWYKNFSGTKTNTSTVCVAGDVLSIAVDLDANTFTFRHNNNPRVSGTIGGTVGRELSPTIQSYNSQHDVLDFNFGQKPFKFPPPDGFQPLNAANVRPDTVIARPDQFVGVSLYTGNGGTQSISSLAFQPDLIWCKTRSNAVDHKLVDSVRGLTNVLESNQAREYSTDTNGITATSSTGFALGSGGDFNSNGRTYVAWSWKAGGNKDTFNVDDVGYASAAAAGLTGGSLAVTGASVGTRQGFSIIKYNHDQNSAQTLSHGLIQTPQFIMDKRFKSGTSTNWDVYHASAPNAETGRLILNSTASYSNEDGPWNDTAPTSSVFTVGPNSWKGDGDHIVYLWHDVPGLQKFGTYIGNGQQNNFVELGFRPAIVWVKRAIANSGPDPSTDYTSWVIMDSTRLSYNGLTPNHLYANSSINEGYRGNASNTSNLGDMLLEPHSNGFFMNNYGSEVNSNTSQYIYCAWAEAPAFNLYGAQSNAR